MRVSDFRVQIHSHSAVLFLGDRSRFQFINLDPVVRLGKVRTMPSENPACKRNRFLGIGGLLLNEERGEWRREKGRERKSRGLVLS